MPTPHSLAEAKQMLTVEKAKVTTSLSAIAGSRWLMAILASFTMAFGLHAIYAPARLPPIGGLSLAQIGLPSGVDFGVVGEQARQAQEAAQRQNVGAHVTQIIDQHAAWVPYVNYAGFALALALLLVNMTIMTRRRRFTRG
ncbi:MAG: hypothetical protein JSS00_04495 [Proteobacteria bacterium]|nr:hypothetical protein [Pseudomonadota bacterium]